MEFYIIVDDPYDPRLALDGEYRWVAIDDAEYLEYDEAMERMRIYQTEFDEELTLMNTCCFYYYNMPSTRSFEDVLEGILGEIQN